MVTTASLEDVILDGAKEVFESMVFMPLEKAAEPVSWADQQMCLATITFIGDMEGCFGICCDQPCVQAIVSGMLCLEPGAPLGDSEISDAIGEIANMIMGGVKTRVQHEIANIEISIPTVTLGRQLQNRLREGMAKVIVPVTVGQQRAELSLIYRHRGN
ncbi:MAG: chemotaxis protein CheX [Solirubrobacterales bacterium]